MFVMEGTGRLSDSSLHLWSEIHLGVKYTSKLHTDKMCVEVISTARLNDMNNLFFKARHIGIAEELH